MKIGALSSSLRKPLPVTLATYAEMGLKGIQLLAAPEILIADDKLLAEYKAMCDSYGLVISAVCGDVCRTHFSVEGEWQDRVRVHNHVVDLAAKLDSHIITTHIGVVPEDRNDPVYEAMAKSLKAAADYSASRGAVLAVETGPEKAAVLKTFLDEIDAPGIHVNLDPGNMAMVTGEDPCISARELAPYICHTHLKDGCHYRDCEPEQVYAAFASGGIKQLFAEHGTAFMEHPIGRGDINWKNYLRTRADLQLDRFPAVIEREISPRAAAETAAAVKFIRDLLAAG